MSSKAGPQERKEGKKKAQPSALSDPNFAERFAKIKGDQSSDGNETKSSKAGKVQLVSFDNVPVTTYESGVHRSGPLSSAGRKAREAWKAKADHRKTVKKAKKKETVKNEKYQSIFQTMDVSKSVFNRGPGISRNSLNKIKSTKLRNTLLEGEKLAKYAAISAQLATDFMKPMTAGFVKTGESKTKAKKLKKKAQQAKQQQAALQYARAKAQMNDDELGGEEDDKEEESKTDAVGEIAHLGMKRRRNEPDDEADALRYGDRVVRKDKFGFTMGTGIAMTSQRTDAVYDMDQDNGDGGDGDDDDEDQVQARTWQLTQEDLRTKVQEGAKKNLFDLGSEDFAPYSVDYSRNGAHLLLGGRKGHLALMDWKHFKLSCEIHVKETVRDVKLLHNEGMFAAAQKKYVYIYDSQGVELHVLRHHIEPTVLDFLPYHYLLVSSGKDGFLRYQDISLGKIVCEYRTKHGDSTCMRQNPQNAVMHLGHADGTVTMWTPNQSSAAVTMFTHKGGVTALAVTPDGCQMVTSGGDGRTKVWDLRTYKMLHEYFNIRQVNTLDVSQTGLLAIGMGPHLQVSRIHRIFFPFQRQLFRSVFHFFLYALHQSMRISLPHGLGFNPHSCRHGIFLSAKSMNRMMVFGSS